LVYRVFHFPFSKNSYNPFNVHATSGKFTINTFTMEKELMKESYVRVVYDPERFIGKVIWTGSPTTEQYKIPFKVLLDWAAKGNKVTRFLSDTREQGVVNPENRKWFEKEMIPAAIKAGLKRAAAVTGGNVFKRYYVNMIISAVNKFGMPLRVFSDEESAVKFLMEEE
jgi:hypothetical protein